MGEQLEKGEGEGNVDRMDEESRGGFCNLSLDESMGRSRSGVVAKGCRGPIVSDFHECPTVAWSSTAFWFATATAGVELVLARTVRERCL